MRKKKPTFRLSPIREPLSRNAIEALDAFESFVLAVNSALQLALTEPGAAWRGQAFLSDKAAKRLVKVILIAKKKGAQP